MKFIQKDIDVNPFHTTDLFLYYLKTWENFWFQGVSKKTSDIKWVTHNDSSIEII